MSTSMSIDITDEESTFTDNTRTIISRNTMDTSSQPAEPTTKKVRFKTSGPRPKSHVHLHFKTTSEGHQCQVKNSNNKICGHIINEGNTTSNRSRHLVNVHGILSPSEMEKVNIINLIRSYDIVNHTICNAFNMLILNINLNNLFLYI